MKSTLGEVVLDYWPLFYNDVTIILSGILTVF